MPFRTLLPKISPIILAVGIGLLVSIPLWLWGVPNGRDLSHHIRLANGYHEALTHGIIYPSWISATNDGYGDPSSRFYPPGFYILISVIQYVVNDWFYTFLIAFTTINCIGSAGMYLWAAELSRNRNAALLATGTFMLTAFHVNALYCGSLYPQYAATCLVPYLFLFVDRLLRAGGWRNVAGAGLSLALIIYFHVPIAIFTIICVTVYSSIQWSSDRKVVSILNLTTAGLVGAVLSAGYWIMPILEIIWKKPTGPEQGEWFDYRNNFLFRTSQNEEGDRLAIIFAFLSLMLFLPNLILLFKRAKRTWALFAICTLTFFLTTPLSEPIWNFSAVLQQTQFPWRWLSMTAVFTAALLSLSFPYIAELLKSSRRPFGLIMIGAIFIPLVFSPFRIMKTTYYLNPFIFQQTFLIQHANKTNSDFLPIWSDGNPEPMTEPVRTSRKVEITEWTNEQKVFNVGGGTEEQARIKLLYYPHWRATTEKGEVLETLPDKDGALLVTVPPEATRISVRFAEPPASRIWGLMSVAGFLIVIFTLLFTCRHKPSSTKDLH